ncbi:MAG: HlyD family efflux transporter periplasmic adaptor subunit, partial [Caldilineae bacterium]
MKKIVLLLVLASFALAGFIVVRDQFRQDTQAGATNQVEAAAPLLPVVKAAESVIVEARVVPRREAGLSMSTNGLVTQVLVANGDRVAAGDVLIQLSNARQRAAVAQAEANLRNAELRVAELQAPARAEEIARYQASIALAQAGLQKVLDGASNGDVVAARSRLATADAARREAQAAYDKVSWRNDIGALPQASALERATNDYVAAEAQLNDLLVGPRRADVVRARAEVTSAQAELDLFLAGTKSETIAAAEANVAAAQAALMDAQAALAETTLRAPFAGTIAAVNVELGESVSPGVAVIHLADVDTWRIETADLNELSVVDVQVGDRVEITFDALPDITLTGRVQYIQPIGQNVQGDITYTVLVELAEQEARLRWNMTAQTTITADPAGRAAA